MLGHGDDTSLTMAEDCDASEDAEYNFRLKELGLGMNGGSMLIFVLRGVRRRFVTFSTLGFQRAGCLGLST